MGQLGKEKRKESRKGGEPPEFAARFFERLDANNDNAVDQTEFEANPRLEKASEEQRQTLFLRHDKNGDGLIRRDEIKPPKSWRHDRPGWFRKGPVTFEEFVQQPRIQRLDQEMQRDLFNRIDQNSDGLLSKEDLPRRRGGLKGPPHGAPSPRKFDTNGDGIISFAEFQKAPFHANLSEDEAEDRFEHLDTNNDGQLTGDELTHPSKGPRPERVRRKNSEQ